MTLPSDKDYEAARVFLRRRLDAELSAERNARELFDRAAARLVEIAYSHGIPPSLFSFGHDVRIRRQVQEVVDWLIAQTEDALLTLCAAHGEQDGDKTAAWIAGKAYGGTLRERITGCAERRRDEIQAACAAALLLGMGQAKALRLALDTAQDPYSNETVARADSKGGLLTRLGVRTSYGRGIPAASTAALTMLARDTVARAWMRARLTAARDGGAVAFRTFRNSSYPCALCDDSAAVIHTADEDMPPLHPHCVCGMAFIYL